MLVNIPKTIIVRTLLILVFISAVCGVASLFIAGKYIAQYQDGERVLISFEDSDDPGYSSWTLLAHMHEYVLQTCCTHSYNKISDFEGRTGKAGVFSLKRTDSHVKGNFRSELRILSNPLEHDTWYRAHIFVPKDWTDSEVKVVAMQWHGSRDFFLGEVGRMPPLEITIVGDRWIVLKSYDDRLISKADLPGNVQQMVQLADLPVEKGRWMEWVIHTRWSSTDDGRLRVWLDGELVSDDKGPNAHRDLTGPYLKAGVYAPSWGYEGTEANIQERTLIFDDIEMAQLADPFNMGKIE